MLARTLTALRSKAYRIFQRPFELNIVGVRARSTTPNRFDDRLEVFYRSDQGAWHHHLFRITTDPGTFWLRSPMHPQGTAILAQGQYENAYQIGLHKGQYEALVQRAPVTILRDYDRNQVLRFLNGSRYSGHFGINIHRASEIGQTKTIDQYSAGCQVFERASDFEVFMQLCQRHRALYGNQFTYTLIDQRALAKATLRRVLIAAFALSLAGTLYLRFIFNKQLMKTTLKLTLFRLLTAAILVPGLQ